MSAPKERTENGSLYVELESPYLKLIMQPALGGKIVDIIDQSAGLSFLLAKDAENAEDSSSFDEQWTGGFDEMFPNDAPFWDQATGLDYRDHGLLWDIDCQYSAVENEQSYILIFNGQSKNGMVSIEKKIILSKQAPVLTYELMLKNIAEKTIDFVYKLHPAFAVDGETSLDIPGEEVFCEDTYNIPPSTRKIYTWPYMPTGDSSYKDMSDWKQYGGRDVAFQTIVLAEPYFMVCRNRYKKAIRFAFAKEQFPYLTLFASGGGFQGIQTAILEPSSALTADFERERKENRIKQLGPKDTYISQITIQVIDL